MKKKEWQIILEYLRNDTRLNGSEIEKFQREVAEKLKVDRYSMKKLAEA